MDKKTTGIVAYLTWVGWLIAYLAGDKEGAKFHINQALVIFLVQIVLGIVAKILNLIPVIRYLTWLLNVAGVVFWLAGLLAAIQEKENPLPFIGEIHLIK